MNKLAAQQLKQPPGLYILFFTELWERFGFYCVQSLFVLFLTKAYHLSDTTTYASFAAFSALIYATPVLGGYIADKFIGYQRAIIVGSILYIIGYFALSTTSQSLFYFALAFLVSGNGFFKGCVSTLLGTLYKKNDPRRDGGFTIFYMGINIGSLISPIVSTAVAMKFGWGYGFGIAGAGIIIGLITLLSGLKKLEGHGLPPNPAALSRPIFLGLSQESLIYLSIFASTLLISIILHYGNIVVHGVDIFVIVTLLFIVGLSFRYDPVQRNKMLLMTILIGFAILFWALYFQIWSSITLFSQRIVDRHLFGWTVPTGMISAIEAFFIIVLSPIFAVLWTKLSNANLDPSRPIKFSLGLILIGAAFLSLSFSTHFAQVNGEVGFGWIPWTLFLVAVGELCLSPIGISMITALAPENLRGMLMGAWFISLSAGYSFGDYLSNLTSIPKNITEPSQMSPIYVHMFHEFGLISIICGMGLIALSPALKKMLSH
jgi:POT family proton-dependent oligopeptide transporter